MNISQQPVERVRAQMLSELLREGGAAGGALVVDVLPRLPLVVIDESPSFTSRRVLLVDGDKAVGTTALVFNVDGSGNIGSVYQAPGDAFAVSRYLPLKGGKSLDTLLERALENVRARTENVAAFPEPRLMDLYDRAERLLQGRNAHEGMFNTPLGSIQITRQESARSLDGSAEYGVKVYKVDLERSVNREDGAGVISRELGFHPNPNERLSAHELGVLLVLAEVQQRLCLQIQNA